MFSRLWQEGPVPETELMNRWVHAVFVAYTPTQRILFFEIERQSPGGAL